MSSPVSLPLGQMHSKCKFLDHPHLTKLREGFAAKIRVCFQQCNLVSEGEICISAFHHLGRKLVAKCALVYLSIC